MSLTREPDNINDAIKLGSLSALQYLVDEKNHQLNPKKRGKDKKSGQQKDDIDPIVLAVMHGRLDIVQWLINEKKYPISRGFYYKKANIKGKRVFNALLPLVMDFEQDDIAIWLLRHYPHDRLILGSEETFFNQTVKEGRLAFCKMLAEEGFYGLTCRGIAHPERIHNPLFIALAHGHVAIAVWLVEQHGFELAIISDSCKNNLLTWALSTCPLDSVKWLVEEKGFLLNEVITAETAPLLAACQNDSLDLVKWLIDEKHVLLDACDGGNRNALIHAVSHERLLIAKYLVEEKNFSLDIKSSTNGTYLVHYAAIVGDLDMLKWLIDEKNCSLEVKNKHDDNLLDLIWITSHVDKIYTWLYLDKNIFSIKWLRDKVKDKLKKNECFSAYRNHLNGVPYAMLNAENEAEIEEWMALHDQKMTEIWRKERNDIYEQAISLLKSKGCAFYRIILNHYADINKESLGHIQLLLDEGEITQAIYLLYNVIDDAIICTFVKNEARLTLAEMLLANLADIEEENSPLNTDDPFLAHDAHLMKRALQAYYLINGIITEKEDKNSMVTRLKSRLQDIFTAEGKLCPPDKKDKTWPEQTKDYHQRYVNFKEGIEKDDQNTDESAGLILQNNYVGQFFKPVVEQQPGVKIEKDKLGSCMRKFKLT